MGYNIKYVYELPYTPRRQLCRILDADKKWNELGGNYMKYDALTMTLIGQVIQCDKSPTSELLNKYSERNGTIKHLFIWLKKMEHERAMSVLKPYVDKKYHRLLRTESIYSASSFICSDVEVIPRPSASQVSSAHKAISGVFDASYEKKKYIASKKPTFEKKAKMNEEDTCNTLIPVTHDSPHLNRKVSAKKSPDHNQLQNTIALEQKKYSRRCVYEKMNKTKKVSFQEIVFNLQEVKPSFHPSGANYRFQIDFSPAIPFSEICKITDNFSDTRVLGRGGFGVVYKGEWKGTLVAIKRLRYETDNSSRPFVSLKQSLNELKILKCCRFDYILPLYAVSLDGVDPCLIFQLMVNGSLEDRLHCKNKTSPLTWLERRDIAECTAKGLNYLHTTYKKPLVHGDIKSANILLDSNMKPKIGDFGLTREGPNCGNTHVDVSSVHGTKFYLPVEYLRNKKLSPQVDVYSFGIVMLEIATGLRPYIIKAQKILTEYVKIYDEFGQVDALRDSTAGEENKLWFKELIQIGQVCSSIEKKKRPPMQEVLVHFENVKSMIRNAIDNVGINLRNRKLQMIYDLKKENLNNKSENNKLLHMSPDIAARGDICYIDQQMQKFSFTSKERDSSCKSLRNEDSYKSCTDDSYTSSESSNSSQSEITTNEKFLGEASPLETRKPPIPLIDILKIQVSKLERNSEELDTGKPLCSDGGIKF